MTEIESIRRGWRGEGRSFGHGGGVGESIMHFANTMTKFLFGAGFHDH
jgi:hypothetical protein